MRGTPNGGNESFMSEQPLHPDPMAEAHELIVAAIDEQLSPEQAQRLEQLVRDNAEVRKLYVLYAHQRTVISMIASPAGEAGEAQLDDDRQSGDAPEAPSLHDTMVLRAITASPSDAEPELRRLPAYPMAPSTAPSGIRGSRVRFVLAAAAVVLLAAGAALVLLRRGATSPAPGQLANRSSPVAPATQPSPAAKPIIIATLTRQIGAAWASPVSSAGFQTGDSLQLTAGYAELAMARGATMVVEAPASLTLSSDNAVSLASGKLAARVPPAARGFAVRTEQSTITDLGTEFGVSTDPAGVTEVDVFKGRVIARATAPSTQPVTLVQGNAAVVTLKTLELQPAGAMPQKFVRTLQTTATALDAVDLIAGGDGTTGRRGIAIDQRSGAYGEFPHRATVYREDAAFHPVAVAAVNGCFIPTGQTTVDSAGDKFRFPSGRGPTYDYIRAGGPMRWPHDNMAFFTPVLSGVNYDSPGHGMLFMHCNNGLTFDLAAIRRLCPEKTVTAFRSVVGNTVTRDDYGNDVTITSSAYVLIDGVARFNRTFTNKDGAIAVDVPIGPKDRFLSLATLATSRPTLNWTIFGDPRFELAK